MLFVWRPWIVLLVLISYFLFTFFTIFCTTKLMQFYGLYVIEIIFMDFNFDIFQRLINHAFDARPWTIHQVTNLFRQWSILIMPRRKSSMNMDRKHVLSKNHANCMRCDKDQLVHNQIGSIFWGNYSFVIKHMENFWIHIFVFAIFCRMI